MAIWMNYGAPWQSRLCVLEAMAGIGVRLHPFTMAVRDYARQHGRVWWCRINDPGIDRNRLVAYALQAWGYPYAIRLEMLAIVEPALRWILWRPIAKNKWHCAKLMAHAFRRAGFRWDRNEWLTTPADVMGFECLDTPVEVDLSEVR
jgi:hypothetical protein